MTEWHTITAEQVFRDLGSSKNGLDSEEAARRLAEYGPNELEEKAKRTPLAMFLGQFKDFMILVLIAAAVAAGFTGKLSDAMAIAVIVILNAVIGFVQEYRAEKAIAALRSMAAPEATVVRDGATMRLPAQMLVPGDMVLFEAGVIVPADLRLTETVQIRINEAALTGESVPVEKNTSAIHEQDIPLGDRSNMAFKGTVITYGRGSGVVVTTGMHSEIGKIARLLQEEEEVRTPLQKRLAVFGRWLAVVVLALCAVFFGAGVLRGEPVFLMLLTAISLVVAAIPEALPAVVTISLALGARKMVKLNALIHKLSAVETLGSVTFICSDKTGTLTLNQMTVEALYTNGRVVLRNDFDASHEDSFLLAAMSLSNDAAEDAGGNLIGDPTETAFYAFARANGFEKSALERDHPRIAEIPFDSERKRMTTIHKWNGAFVSFTKGALEGIGQRADRVRIHGKDEPIPDQALLKAGEEMASDGLRTLGIAMRKWEKLPDDINPETVENELILLGIAGLMDPPREEAKAAVAECKTAGIRPVMITGDHRSTATAIARRLGILDDSEEAVLTGAELEDLPQEEFERKVEDIRVYARVAPEQKLKIIKALQARGQFVAMTGDGVNDAPALRRADIGIAMGITGTDVSKEAAHMILLDDNFATIVNAVREGRRIFDNIRKFIRYAMTSNTGELWTLFIAPFLGFPIPLLPIHILWLNIITDGLPGLAFAAEPAEKEIMKRPPRHPQENIFSHGLGRDVIWVGLLMGFVAIGILSWGIVGNNDHWQTLVFTVLCLSQLGNALAVRSENESLLTLGLRSNIPMLVTLLFTFVLLVATIYIPFMNKVFYTSPLTAGELAIAIAASSVVFIAFEVKKTVLRVLRRKSSPQQSL